MYSSGRFIFIIIYFISTVAFAQSPPAIQWQKCFGGTLDDTGYGITATSDGGYFIVGCAGSSDGDILKTEEVQHGGTCDYWGLKIDGSGNEQFKIHLGGTGSDVAREVIQTPDGNYVVGGATSSNDVDITGNHGDLDFWVVKVNSGSVIWKKCYGGSTYDDFGSLINTSDGNLAFCGGTLSNNGDVSGNHNSSDFWLVKTDGDGNIQWQKCYGSTGYEKAFDLKQCDDGGYILAGFTDGNDSDVSGNHSSDYDGWVVKTDANGNLQWQKCLGGSGQDGFFKVIQLSDNNFLLAGYAFSNDGDITGKHGDESTDDAWLTLLDPNGTLLWSKVYGGDSTDEFYAMEQDQLGKVIAGGFTKSLNGDVGFNYGDKDYWLLRIDEDGSILWDTVYGGTYAEVCYDMASANDGGIVLNGYTTSNDYDVSGNHGASIGYPAKKDYWVVKLESVVGIHEILASELSLVPTLAHDVIQINGLDNENTSLVVSDVDGVRVINQQANVSSQLLVNVSSLPQGIYFVDVSTEKKHYSGKFFKW